MDSINKPVIECKREFKLLQQYPSMIKTTKNIRKTVVINASLQSLTPAITRNKIGEQTKNGFHKFRLKLLSGKDLGECNVQILSHNSNILKDKTVKIVNKNKCKPFNKSIVLLNTMSKNETKNMVDNISLRSMNSLAQKNIKLSNMKYSHQISSNIKNNNIEASNNDVKYQTQSIPLKYSVNNNQPSEGIKNKNIENMDTDIITDRECNKNGRLEHIDIQRMLETDNQSTNRNSFSELSNYLSFPINEILNYSVNTSGAIDKTIENNSDMTNSGFQNDHQLNVKEKLYPVSVEDRIENKSCVKPNKIDLKSDNQSLTHQIVNTTYNKSITDQKMINTENVMVLVHDNGKSLLHNDMKTVNEMNGNPINNRNHQVCNDSNNSIVTATSFYENFKPIDVVPNTLQLNENQNNIEQNIDKSLKINHVVESASLKERCSSCNILKDLISNIQNENLKLRALKAFADSPIEKEQQISLEIPKDTRTEPGTKVQTDSYSILESNNFLNMKEYIHNIVEMAPKESDCAYIPKHLDVNSLHYTPFHKNPSFSPFNPLVESNMLLDKSINDDVINDICNEHSTANKVKEVLFQSNVSCNKILEQLQRDFETVKNWDENGMLNIHKAVISNRINDVKRYLMVFKVRNVDVDIPTQSDMTSLELAVKYNASTEMVKLLLEAGANPASSQIIHESALIIASKTNSSLLPLLINHVPSSRLLDYMDFTGFAALHYCAQHGNLVGVSLLINMGANVNLQENRSGRTPLFLAIENNYPVIAKKLIESGAQADIPNFSGQTVMSLVEKIKHLSLITMLYSMS